METTKWSAGLSSPLTANLVYNDNVQALFGTDSDVAVMLNPDAVTVDTTESGILEGTVVSPALAANSLMIGNITNDGDLLFAVSDGGNSYGMLFIDGSRRCVAIPQDGDGTNGMLLVGRGFDASIMWDGSNLIIDPSYGNGTPASAETIIQNNANTAGVTVATFRHDRGAGNAADNDFFGIDFDLRTDIDTLIPALRMTVYIDDVTSSSLGSHVVFNCYTAGVLRNFLEFGENGAAGPGMFVINQAAMNVDFRIEGQTNPNLLCTDGSTDRVGIGTATPAQLLHINQSGTTAAIAALHLEQDDVSEEFIRFTGQAAAGVLTQSIVDEGDVTTATRAGWVKVNVQDEGNQITDQAYFMPLFTLA